MGGWVKVIDANIAKPHSTPDEHTLKIATEIRSHKGNYDRENPNDVIELFNHTCLIISEDFQAEEARMNEQSVICAPPLLAL